VDTAITMSSVYVGVSPARMRWTRVALEGRVGESAKADFVSFKPGFPTR